MSIDAGRAPQLDDLPPDTRHDDRRRRHHDGPDLGPVELRYFAGMSEDEIAGAIGVSRSSVTREWQTARAWLYRRLTICAGDR